MHGGVYVCKQQISVYFLSSTKLDILRKSNCKNSFLRPSQLKTLHSVEKFKESIYLGEALKSNNEQYYLYDQ